MNKVRIIITSKESFSEEHESDIIDENILKNMLKKSFKKLKYDNDVFVVAVGDILLNGQKTHEGGIMSADGMIIKAEIRKV